MLSKPDDYCKYDAFVLEHGADAHFELYSSYCIVKALRKKANRLKFKKFMIFFIVFIPFYQIYHNCRKVPRPG